MMINIHPRLYYKGVLAGNLLDVKMLHFSNHVFNNIVLVF